MENINRALADWNSPTPYKYVPNRGDVDVAAGFEEILTPDKANAMYFAATVFPLRDDHPDFLGIDDWKLRAGSSGLSSRLGNRVSSEGRFVVRDLKRIPGVIEG